MTPVNYSKDQLKYAYFLPHHAVIRPDKITSKIRVVFDASAKTSSGISLNDTLKVGPVVQSDIFTILLQFRLYKYAFTSDCEKMYRQVLIDSSDRKFQNILWRDNPQAQLQAYQLNTVTYGIASSSYLATKCIATIADNNAHNHPVSSKFIKNSFYVDDFIASFDDAEKASRVINEINYLLSQHGFNMRKWSSNHPNLLSNIDSKESLTYFSDNNTDQKTLGLNWNAKNDLLQFVFNTTTENNKQCTKRMILGAISSVFDPLGLVGPIIVKSKIIMQRLWQCNLNWDDEVPANAKALWQTYQSDLPNIKNINIPRQIICDDHTQVEIHAFSDASQLSYGTCVYIRSTNSLGHHVNLICSKGRVAPLKVVTIPRLELMVAHLSAQLVSKICKKLDIIIKKIYYWTDSTIVLAWLNKPPNQLKPFVSHRVSDIVSLTAVSQWQHVSSEDNPADVLSRGTNASNLASCHIWWHGPIWLQCDKHAWPVSSIQIPDKNLPEIKSVNTCLTDIEQSNVFLKLVQKISSFKKLLRITAFCIRFKNNTSRLSIKNCGPLTTVELNNAVKVLVRCVQYQVFNVEIDRLIKQKCIPSDSKLKCLNPYLDSDNLIRAGGRIRHSNETYNKKFPYIIPKKHALTNLIVLYYHILHLHAGVETVISAIRQTYWIISVKNIVKNMIRNCVICRRFNARPHQPIMGDLPATRIIPSKPFSICGTDFAGPFNLSSLRASRRSKTSKAYLCIFVCFSTKAVHLKLVSNLSTEAFIACLRRFLSRRGFCKEIHSDNGSNFIGAAREIKL